MNVRTYLYIAGISFLVFLIVVFSCAFVVTEIDQVVVTKLGRPVRVIAGESPFSDKRGDS